MRKLNRTQAWRASQQEFPDYVELEYETRRRFREQKGQVVERSDGWYLRFYVDDPVFEGRRAKVSERLNVRDDADRHEIEAARRKRMKAVNAECHADRKMPAGELLIGDFWTNYYLPYAKDTLRWSSWRGMENRWRQYLESHLAKQSLRRYTTGDASRFLTGLAKKKLASGAIGLSTHSLAHVRSLMSCIFSYAVNKECIDRNPMAEVKVLARVRKPKPTIEYSLKEMTDILGAIPRTDAKLFFALCSFLAMRPSEAAAVKWEAIDLEALQLKVEDAAAYGHEGEGLKTEQSRRELLIHEPVTSLMIAYREDCGGDEAEGYLFTRPGGLPVNHNAFARRHIGKFAKKVCPRWCGLYAGRRGTGSLLFNQTKGGDVRAAYQVMGNSLATAIAKYIKASKAEGRAGQKRLEAAFLKTLQGARA